LLGANGFPAISVPAGFTTEVYDRVRKPVTGVESNAARSSAGSEGTQAKSATERPAREPPAGATELLGPITAKLPVGIDFLARPFDEPKLLRIAAAYEAATRHRTPPPEFGPVAGEP
jgi:amidase